MKKLLLLITCLVLKDCIYSQCVVPGTVPVLACGSGSPLLSGESIIAGQTRFANAGTYDNISLNGGDIVLCGNVSITNINVNSGRIFINEGAIVSITGSFSAATHALYNRGSVTFAPSINVQGVGTFVYNDLGATITVTGTLAVLNSGLFVNYGRVVANDVNINSGGNICLGAGSFAEVASIQNNQTNSVNVPVGTSCISYTGNITGNNAISNTSNLIICQRPGANPASPTLTGSATVLPNCSGCNIVLPVHLIRFTGTRQESAVLLEWETASEEGIANYVIEYSKEGTDFIEAAVVESHNQSGIYRYAVPLADNYRFYRLRIEELSGASYYSSVLYVATQDIEKNALVIAPNPVTTSVDVRLEFDRAEQAELILADLNGRVVERRKQNFLRGSTVINWDLTNYQSGMYVLQLRGESGSLLTARILKR